MLPGWALTAGAGLGGGGSGTRLWNRLDGHRLSDSRPTKGSLAGARSQISYEEPVVWLSDERGQVCVGPLGGAVTAPAWTVRVGRLLPVLRTFCAQLTACTSDYFWYSRLRGGTYS